MPVPGGTPDYVVAQGEGDPDFTVEIDGGGGGGTPGVDYLTPGESLTQITADDGGVGYEGSNNVPVFAFRTEGNVQDRLQIWADSTILFYEGSGTPTDPLLEIGAGSAAIIQAPAVPLVVSSPQGTKLSNNPAAALGFFGTTPIVQPAAIANATDAASVIARLNDLLAAMRSLGLIDT